MKVTVVQKNERFELEMDENDTLKTLRNKFNETKPLTRNRYSHGYRTLRFDGERLLSTDENNKKALGEFGITDGSEVHAIIHHQVGMLHHTSGRSGTYTPLPKPNPKELMKAKLKELEEQRKRKR